MRRLRSDTVFDRIKSFYLEDDIVLSEFEENIRQRWISAFAILLNDEYTDANAVAILVKNFDINEVTAYRDLANARKLFSDSRQASKEALRYIVTQRAWKTFQMAETKKDFRGMEKMLDRVIKANNLDKEDMDIPDPSTWNPPTQMINIDFNFFYSEFAVFINEKTKEEFNTLIEQINALVSKSSIRNYFQPFKPIETKQKKLTDGSVE